MPILLLRIHWNEYTLRKYKTLREKITHLFEPFKIISINQYDIHNYVGYIKQKFFEINRKEWIVCSSRYINDVCKRKSNLAYHCYTSHTYMHLNTVLRILLREKILKETIHGTYIIYIIRRNKWENTIHKIVWKVLKLFCKFDN